MTRNEITATVVSNVVQAQRIDALVLPGRAPEALAGLPADPAVFTGRGAEVAAVQALLKPGGAIAAISGPPGVGKTAVAVRAARLAIGRGRGRGALFAELGEDVDAHAALGVFLRALGLRGSDIPSGPTTRRQLYVSRLHELTKVGRRLVVVLDNATSAEQVRKLLPSPGHDLVVTSRESLPTVNGARQFTLDPLPHEAGVELLAGLLTAARPGDPRAGETEALGGIAWACGGLPLALTVAAGLLVDEPRQPAAELAERLVSADRLAQLSLGGLDVRLAFTESYRRLGGGERRLFRLLGLHPGPVITPEAAAVLAGVAAGVAEPWLAGLRRAHLITPDGAGYRLAGLLREFSAECRAAEGEDGAEAVARLVRHHRLRAQAADNSVRERRGRADPAAALRWLDEQRLCLIGMVELAAGHGLHQDTVALALALRHLLELRGRLDEWVRTQRLALDAARELADPRAQGEVLIALGDAYRRGGEKHTAAHCYHLAHALADPDAIDRLMSLTGTDERTALAEEHFAAAVAAYRKRGDLRRLAHALEHLGRLRERARAELVLHAEAGELYEQLGDQLGRARVWLRIGQARYHATKYEEAAECFREVLDLLEGPHRYRGLAWFDLGLAQFALGRPGQARRSWRQALTELPESRLPRIHRLRWWRNRRLRRMRPLVADYVAVPVAVLAARDLWDEVPADPSPDTAAAESAEQPEHQAVATPAPALSLQAVAYEGWAGDWGGGSDGGSDGGEGCGCGTIDDGHADHYQPY